MSLNYYQVLKVGTNTTSDQICESCKQLNQLKMNSKKIKLETF